MMEFLWEVLSLIPCLSTGYTRSHLYTVSIQLDDTLYIRVLVPDSELPHELVPSPLDLKATSGTGIIPILHLTCPTL